MQMLIITKFLCIFAPYFSNLLIYFIIMVTKDLLIAFLNVQKTLEISDVKASSKEISFFAPAKNLPYIVDIFEPTFGTVTFSDSKNKIIYYVIS